MKIGFHTNGLGFRGTDRAVFDYAWWGRELLKIDPVIIVPETGSMTNEMIFKREFKVKPYSDLKEVTKDLDACYFIKYGYDDKITCECPQLVHAVFDATQPHGHKYAAVSEWLALHHNCVHFVPHIVNPVWNTEGAFKSHFGIPKDSIVIGCIGGSDSFDIQWAKDTLVNFVIQNPNVYFLSRGLDSFSSHPRMIFKPAIANPMDVISISDVMLHARFRGETFGLAVGEFATSGVPVITYGGSGEKAHLFHFKGDPACVMYLDEKDLRDALNNITNLPKPNINNWKEFEPPAVMNKFKEVFLTN